MQVTTDNTYTIYVDTPNYADLKPEYCKDGQSVTFWAKGNDPELDCIITGKLTVD